jgi:predicted secreted protein
LAGSEKSKDAPLGAGVCEDELETVIGSTVVFGEPIALASVSISVIDGLPADAKVPVIIDPDTVSGEPSDEVAVMVEPETLPEIAAENVVPATAELPDKARADSVGGTGIVKAGLV